MILVCFDCKPPVTGEPYYRGHCTKCDKQHARCTDIDEHQRIAGVIVKNE